MCVCVCVCMVPVVALEQADGRLAGVERGRHGVSTRGGGVVREGGKGYYERVCYYERVR